MEDFGASFGEAHNATVSQPKPIYRRFWFWFSIVVAISGIAGSLYPYIHGSNPEMITTTTTSYATQTMANSPNGIQVQGTGNTIITKPEREPITEYSVWNATTTSDGSWLSGVQVHIAFAGEGKLEINAKLKCTRDWEHPGGPLSIAQNGVVIGVGTEIYFNCVSTEPIPEKAGYFLWVNSSR